MEGRGQALAAVAGGSAALEAWRAVLDLIWVRLGAARCLRAMWMSTPVLASRLRLLLRCWPVARGLLARL
jgi:hypothetical protein